MKTVFVRPSRSELAENGTRGAPICLHNIRSNLNDSYTPYETCGAEQGACLVAKMAPDLLRVGSGRMMRIPTRSQGRSAAPTEVYAMTQVLSFRLHLIIYAVCSDALAQRDGEGDCKFGGSLLHCADGGGVARKYSCHIVVGQ